MSDAVADVYRLTSTQQGILFHSLAEPRAGLYIVQMRFELHGALDPQAFATAWRRAVDRHPALRTGLAWEGIAHPVQVVLREAQLPIVETDLRSTPAADRSARREAILAADRQLGFDLTQPPLMRLSIVRLADEAYELGWTHHHAVLDGWATALVFEEVLGDYEELTGGEPHRPPPSRPFRDHVLRQARRNRADDEWFWSDWLADVGPPVRLRGDRRRVETAPHERSASQTLAVSASRVERWRAAARHHRVAFNTLVQGAFALLLARDGEQAGGDVDVVFGAVRSTRFDPSDDEEAPRIVGVCLNTLPVRVPVRAADRLGAFLQRIQRDQATVSPHDGVELARLRGQDGRAPFRYVLGVENFPHDVLTRPMSAGGVEFRYADVIESTNYPLVASVPVGPGPSLKMMFDRGRFTPTRVEELLVAWAGLLDDLDASETATIGDIIAPPTRPAAAAGSPGAHTLVARFDAHAATRPDAVAVAAGSRRISYGELRVRSEELARNLRARGVGPEVRVGLAVPRSIEMVVAMVAILRAGGAYVPLDPAYPQARLAFIVADCAVRIVVSAEDGLPAVAGLAGVEVVELDRVRAEAPPPGPRLASGVHEVRAGHAAYVIHTSGSSGRPKGVVVTHANLVALLDACAGVYGFDESDVWTQVHSVAFDFSVWEIWGALLHGGRLVVVPDGPSRLGEALRDLVRRERVTVLSQTPSAFTMFAEADAADAVGIGGALRFVVFGGEDLARITLTPWLDRYGDRQPRLVNMYGITETTVHVTQHPIAQADLRGERSTSRIGFPIPGWTTHVLGPDMRPVPRGVAGELFVGGHGVARGYEARPGLTAARYVPDPTGHGQRLYRSGDRVREHPDGLEYLGRLDDQVEVRGVRIEPGEVEAAVVSFPSVAQCVVVAKTVARQDDRLLCYVVPVVGRDVDPKALRAHVGETLPAAMVPSKFLPVPHLPMTPSGKVDRRRVAEWASGSAGSSRSEPPRPAGPPHLGRTEPQVAAIWAEVLHLQEVGHDENFFDLGGNSLMLFDILRRLRAAGHVELTMEVLFEAPTVTALARRLSPAGPANHDRPSPVVGSRAKALAEQRRRRQRDG